MLWISFHNLQWVIKIEQTTIRKHPQPYFAICLLINYVPGFSFNSTQISDGDGGETHSAQSPDVLVMTSWRRVEKMLKYFV